MTENSSDGDGHWDAYPSRVDGAPASILLRMDFLSEDRPAEADTLYVIGTAMADPGEDGLGTTAEAVAFNPFEEALTHALDGKSFVNVGRLRNLGSWQISFYGPKEQDETFFDAIGAHVHQLSGEVWTHIDHDPEWGYYFGFLAPDVERRVWMRNRDLVEEVASACDDLESPRPVDYVAYFQTRDSLDAFAAAADKAGYALQQIGDEPNAEGATRADFVKAGPVTLEEVHERVMRFIELLEDHDGEYDGWATVIVQQAQDNGGDQPFSTSQTPSPK